MLIFNIKISPIKPSRPDPGRREKINLNFCFRTSSWCLKRFYEGLTKKCENKNSSYFLFYYNFLKCTGREGLILMTITNII